MFGDRTSKPGRCVDNLTFWICALIACIFVAHWIVHKYRQFKIRIRQLELELMFFLEYYGKEREEKRAKEASEEGQDNTKKR